MNSIKNTGFMCHSREALNVAGIIFNIVCEYWQKKCSWL